jgi:hypothetical protein
LNTFIDLTEPKGKSKEDYQQFRNNCKVIFGRILDQLNNVFTSITSTHCRTSIKLTYTGSDNKLYVYTLTRDQASRQRCLEMDKRRAAENHDPLDKNIQFARLLSAQEDVWSYSCNDLTKEESFQATSLTAYDPSYATKAPTRSRWRRKSWPLPYRSTIACVIRQGPFDMAEHIPAEVLGFLTVDSESRNVFEERWDVQIMLAVADALYGPIRGYINAQNRAPK